MPQLLDTSAAPVAGHAARSGVPRLDLGALHPQAVGVAGDGAGRCGAVAYLLAGGSAATGWSMGASLAPVAPSGASGSMFAGLPAAPVLDPLAQARATFNVLGAAEKRALMLYVESMGSGGAGQAMGAQALDQGRRSHSVMQQGRLPPHAGSAQARASTITPQAHDWVCPRCSVVIHGRHWACPDCRVDKAGLEVVAGRCPWRCSSCGHINIFREDVCRGTQGLHCGHLRSIVGSLGAEFTGNDWVCVPCREHGGSLVRMWVRSQACRVCFTPRADMFGVTLVKDYAQGTAFI